MLVELLVENYAVVDRIRTRFHPGLNLLTGETGSGKSIVVDALGLLFGARASAEMIRSGEARAHVAGIFDVRDRGAVAAILDPAGIALEDSELLIEREILAGGKSRAFIGSRPVAASLLRDLAPLLGDIHGQHDQQLLFLPDAQREMLDIYAASSGLLAHIASIYNCWNSAGTALAELERTEQEKLRLLDLWEFQRKEIENAAPLAGEDESLETERRVLQNLGRLQESAGIGHMPRCTILRKPLWRKFAPPRSAWMTCSASIPRWHRFRSSFSPPKWLSKKPPTACAATFRASKPIPGVWRRSKSGLRCSKS